MHPLKIRLFKNTYKQQGDNKPSYQNSSISYPDDVFPEDYTFKKGTKHQIGLWKNEDGTLYVEIKEKVDSSVQPQATSQSSMKPEHIMGRPEYQQAQMQKINEKKSQSNNNAQSEGEDIEKEEIPF